MASEKNITMRQFNGVDYDTLYPKTKVEQVEGAYTQQQILADSTKRLYGLGSDAVPDDVLALLKTLVDNVQNHADSKAKIEFGNYTGTGANSDTAITLTFSFKPKVVIVAGPGSHVVKGLGTAIFMQGAVNSKIDVGGTVGGVYVNGYLFDLTWRGNSVTWKGRNTVTAEACLNVNNAKYYYVAIG